MYEFLLVGSRLVFEFRSGFEKLNLLLLVRVEKYW